MAKGRSMAMEIVITARDKASRALHNMRSNIRSIASSIGTRMVDAIRGAIQWLMKMATWIGIIGTAITVELGRRVSNAFAEFDDAITQAAMMTGKTGEALEKVKKQLSDFASVQAKVAKKTQTDIANSFYALMSAGLSAAEVIQVFPGVLALAEATGSDLLTTTELMTSSLRAFGLEMSQSDRAANVLGATITSTRATMERLSAAMPYAQTSAAAVGATYEQTAAALGLLMNYGMRATMAGTGLSGTFDKLVKTTAEGEKALAKYGLTAAAVDPTQVGLMRSLRRLHDAHMSYADTLTIFGRRAGRSAKILVDNVDQYAALTQKVTGTNRAFEMQATAMDTLSSQWKAFKGDIQRILIIIGQAFAPAIDKILAALRDLGAWVAEEGVAEAIGNAFRWAAEAMIAFFSAFGTVEDLHAFIFKITRALVGLAQIAYAFVTGATFQQWAADVRKLISGLLAFMMGKAQFPERLMWQVVQGMYKALLWLAGKADIIITRIFKAIWGEEGVEIWNEFKKAISSLFQTLVEQAPALASAVATLLPPLLKLINGIAWFIGKLSDLHPSLGAAGIAVLLFWDKLVALYNLFSGGAISAALLSIVPSLGAVTGAAEALLAALLAIPGAIYIAGIIIGSGIPYVVTGVGKAIAGAQRKTTQEAQTFGLDIPEATHWGTLKRMFGFETERERAIKQWRESPTPQNLHVDLYMGTEKMGEAMGQVADRRIKVNHQGAAAF